MSVSVIIPFYNSIKYLDRAIESCLIQKEASQIILVDDGSTDASYTCAKNHAQNDERIILARHDMNKGRSAARNTGMGLINQKYAAFLDADDYFLPHRFSKDLDLLNENPQTGGVYGYVRSQFEQEAYRNEVPFGNVTGIEKDIAADRLFEYLLFSKGGHISLLGCTFRSSVIRNYSFDEDLEITEDTDFLWKVARSHSLIKSGEKCFVIRTVHGGNSYFNEKKVLENKVLFYRKWWANASSMKLSKKVSIKILKSYVHYVALLNGHEAPEGITKFFFVLRAAMSYPRSLIRLI